MKRLGCRNNDGKELVFDTNSLPSLPLEAACARLIESCAVENWWPSQSRFEVLVGAILVQNTRWTNVEKAIDRLRDHQYLDPVRLSRTQPADLQILIRSAGCQSVKARRLQSLANWVVDSGGLEALDALATLQLRDELLKVHGIGEETADAILCFGFARRVFIADQYARVWLTRMGFVAESETRNYSACRDLVEPALAASTICMQDLHAAIVIHGQSICRREPKCSKCILTAICPHGLVVGKHGACPNQTLVR
jgi:endonuclease-3 related protein